MPTDAPAPAATATIRIEVMGRESDDWAPYGDPITPVAAIRFLTSSAPAQFTTEGRIFRALDDRGPRGLESLRAEVRGWS